MRHQKLSRLMRHLRSTGIFLASTGFLLLGTEIFLSTLVYREKGYVELAFCRGKFVYTADCLNPHPLFHFRIAGLALFNAIAMKPAYHARRFINLTERELEGLNPWKIRRGRKEILPWSPSVSVEYIYDSMGRRVATPANPQKPKQKFLAFFGGSWAHGDWLPYEQTLPGQMEKRMPEYRVYNYGIQGGGLQELFLGSHSPGFIGGIPEKSGVYVYVYTWMHMDRLRPSISYIAGRFNSPMANYVDDKELGFGGSFYEGFPVLTPTLTFIYHSGIGKISGLSKRLLPRWNLENFYCDLLVQTRDRLESLNASAKFVVLIYGQSYYRESWRLPIRCLEENKIPYYAPFFGGKLAETYLPDGHPDSKTHQEVADRFRQWLSAGSWRK
jgi:hypothetical protein